jgi:Right handed beta helix region
MPAQNNPNGSTPPAARRHSRRVAAAAVAGAGAAALLAMSLTGVFSGGAANAAVKTNCMASPGTCGFADAASTGVPSNITLKTVPGQVSSGTGWSYDAATSQVNVTGNGAVLTGLSIPCNLNITASNVTINDDKVLTGGTYGITIQHTANVTIENSTVSGLNQTTGRVNYAIDDLYSDSTGLVIKNNDVADWRIGVNVAGGQVTGNYIHDPGYIAGDHTDGLYDNGGTMPLTISGNTILNNLTEVDAIFLSSNAGATISNKTITNNLLAGGGYAIYAGSHARSASNIVIRENRFSQLYYPSGGRYGPIADFDPRGKGNVWSDNVWTAHVPPRDVQSGMVRDNGRAGLIPAP